MTASVEQTSPEYAAIVECTPLLVDSLKGGLDNICDDLFSEWWISEAERETLQLTTLEPSKKAQIIIDAVRAKIKCNPKVYEKFVSILQKQGAWLKDCVDRLTKWYKASLNATRPNATSRSDQAVKTNHGPGFVCPFCQNCTLEKFFRKGCPKGKARGKRLIRAKSLSFPFLDTSKLSEKDKDTLERQLISEFKEIEKKFCDFSVSIVKSSTRFPIQEIKVFLLGKKVFTAEEVAKLETASSMTDILTALYYHTSFFHYEMIEQILDKFGSSGDKQMLQKYLAEFKKYCEHNVFEVPPSEFHSQVDQESYSFFALKYSPEHSITLERAKSVCRNVASILHIDPWALRLISIEKGCVLLTFAIPNAIAANVLPISSLQLVALSYMGLTVQTDGDSQEEVQQSRDQHSSQGIESSLVNEVSHLRSNQHLLEQEMAVCRELKQELAQEPHSSDSTQDLVVTIKGDFEGDNNRQRIKQMEEELLYLKQQVHVTKKDFETERQVRERLEREKQSYTAEITSLKVQLGQCRTSLHEATKQSAHLRLRNQYLEGRNRMLVTKNMRLSQHPNLPPSLYGTSQAQESTILPPYTSNFFTSPGSPDLINSIYHPATGCSGDLQSTPALCDTGPFLTPNASPSNDCLQTDQLPIIDISALGQPFVEVEVNNRKRQSPSYSPPPPPKNLKGEDSGFEVSPEVCTDSIYIDCPGPDLYSGLDTGHPIIASLVELDPDPDKQEKTCVEQPIAKMLKHSPYNPHLGLSDAELHVSETDNTKLTAPHQKPEVKRKQTLASPMSADQSSIEELPATCDRLQDVVTSCDQSYDHQSPAPSPGATVPYQEAPLENNP